MNHLPYTSGEVEILMFLPFCAPPEVVITYLESFLRKLTFLVKLMQPSQTTWNKEGYKSVLESLCYGQQQDATVIEKQLLEFQV